MYNAIQGNGEIAGHTTDGSVIIRLRIEVIKDVNIEGPILLPKVEDLPYLAKPYTKEEKKKAKKFAEKYDVKLEDSLPISFVGTGATLNDTTNNGLERAEKLFI